MSDVMNADRYAAGIATAYGAAVQGGYTGTYAQFCAQQAQFAENAQAVEEAKQEVLSTVQTFENTTVPAAITQVQEEGTAQIQVVQDATAQQITALQEEGLRQQAAVVEAAADQVEASRTQAQRSENAADASEGYRDETQGLKNTFENTTVPAAVQTVQNAGAAQVQAVEQAGSDQVDAVELAGSTQVGNVNSAGTIQVGNVNTAGTTQVQAVEDKGEEVLNSIPADYTELMGDVDNLKSAFVTPQMFGAKADGTTDDTVAIQSAIDSGIRVLFPKGVYIVSAPLMITKAGTVLEGVNNYDYTSTLNGAKLKIKASTWSDAFFKFEHGADNSIIRNLQMEGTLPGLTGAYQPENGILFDSAVSDEFVAGCCFENLFISYCTRGVSMNSIFKTRFENVYVSNCRAYGFFLAGKSGVANATMLTLINCYANTCVRGYYLRRVSYSSLINCASDNQTVVDYSIETCNTISMQSCGSEGSSGNIIFLGGSCNGFAISGLECISMQAIGSGLPDAVIYSNGVSSVTISGVVYVGENPRTYDIQSTSVAVFVVLGNTIEKTKCSRPYDVTLIPADLA